MAKTWRKYFFHQFVCVGCLNVCFFGVLNPFLAKKNILTTFQGRIMSSRGAKNVKYWLKPGKNIFFSKLHVWGVWIYGFFGAESIFCTNKLFWPTFRAVLWVPGEPKRSNLGFNMVKILFSPNCIVRCLNILNYQNIHLFHIKLG